MMVVVVVRLKVNQRLFSGREVGGVGDRPRSESLAQLSLGSGARRLTRSDACYREVMTGTVKL
jgi:hypothetical protein